MNNKLGGFKPAAAFTLAEMMVVMLVLSIVMAASLPIITRRAKVSEAIWHYAANHSDIYSQLGTTQGAILGDTAFGGSDPASKLLIKTPASTTHDILFKEDIGGVSTKTGFLDVNSKGFIGLGDYDTSSNGFLDGVVIGKTATLVDHNGIAIGGNSVAGGIAIGEGANAKGDSSNVTIGYQAAYKHTNFGSNIAIGQYASYWNLTGTANTAVGHQAANGNTTDGTTAIGYQTAYYHTGKDASNATNPITAVGSEAAFMNSNGGYNTAVGYQASYLNQTGSHVTALGYRAAFKNTAGGLVTYSPDLANFYDASTGITAIGYKALFNNTAGFSNTAVGSHALLNSTDGDNNTSIGNNAGYKNTTGNQNTSIGSYAGFSNVSGYNNTAIGFEACKNVTGTYKTCVGALSGPAPSSSYATDNIERVFIGGQTHYPALTGSVLEVHNPAYSADVTEPAVVINGNLIVKGNAYFQPGDSQMVTMVNGSFYDLLLDPDRTAPLWSDRRLKNVGKSFNFGLDKIKEIKVYNYTFKKDAQKTPRVGVMAQDLQKVFPNAVVKDKSGYLKIRQDDIFYALINSVKQLDIMMQNLFKDVKSAFVRIQTLEDKVAALINVDKINSNEINSIKYQNRKLVRDNKELKIKVRMLLEENIKQSNEIKKINSRLIMLEKK